MIRSLKSRLKRLVRYSGPGTISKQYLLDIVPKNSIIVEAGAHIGSDTMELSQILPNSQIHAFEPVPSVYEKLVRNTKHCRNVTCYPLALGEQSGRAKIFVSSGRSDASSSLLPPKQHLEDHPDVFFQTEIEIQTITLNDWMTQYQLPRVDLLWLDMQGYELAALKSGWKALATASAIYTEVNLVETYAGAPLYSQVREWLADQGFEVRREELPWHDAGNVLFVRRS